MRAMALKYSVVLLSLVIAAMAIPPQAKAQLGIINDLLGSVSIQGNVMCTSKDMMGSVNGAAIPAFPNAQVQLQCGGKVFSKATTDSAGKFSMKMDSLLYDLSSLLNGCSLVVPTPLSNCDSKLPSIGGLISTLKFLGITGSATQSVANIIPSGFQFVPSN